MKTLQALKNKALTCSVNCISCNMLHGQQDRFFKNKNGNEDKRRLLPETCTLLKSHLYNIKTSINKKTTSKQTNKMTISIILLLLGILTQKGHPWMMLHMHAFSNRPFAFPLDFRQRAVSKYPLILLGRAP